MNNHVDTNTLNNDTVNNNIKNYINEPVSPTSSDNSDTTTFKTPWKLYSRSWADMCSSDED